MNFKWGTVDPIQTKNNTNKMISFWPFVKLHASKVENQNDSIRNTTGKMMQK